MKRWEEVLKEDPPAQLSAAIEAQVRTELKSARGVSPRRWWMQLAGMSLAAAAVAGGYRLVQRKDGLSVEGEHQFLELVENEGLDLDTLENLDVIEILEELERWPNG